MTMTTRVACLALTALGSIARAGRADDAPTSRTPPPAAARAPTTAPIVRALVAHVPPQVSPAGEAIEIEAMIDAALAETIEVRWRAAGETTWRRAVLERSSAGGWYATLPATTAPTIEYYIAGRDAAGHESPHFASADAPHVVAVLPSLVDRLEDADRRRLADRRDQIAIDVVGHNFGNRYELADRFVRAELAYSHRLFRVLHQITFGFGSISGKTPLMSEPDGDVAGRALRYGFGQIRIRAHPSVFLDARAALGVSHAGFDQGVAGAITFGKPWRSNLAIGGETLGDLGPTAWIRLQWDTAPPLLMGASIVRSDLPGAVIDSAGLYLGYDVAYAIADRFTVRAQLSYGSRDGAAHFGGGLGSAIDF